MAEATQNFRDIKRALRRLAELMHIAPTTGWQKRAAKSLGFKAGTFSAWIRRGKIPPDSLYAIEKAGYPAERWLDEPKTPPTEAKTRPYTQEEEQVLQQHPPGAPGSYQLVTVVDPADAVYIRKVEEIFEGEEMGAAIALKSNIDHFHDKLLYRKKMEGWLDVLSGKVDTLQSSIGELLAQHKPPEGTEERRKGFIALKEAIGSLGKPGEASKGNGGAKD